MINMKKILYITALAGWILTNTSCENYDETKIPEKYHKVLILQSAGEQAITLYRTGEDSNYEMCIIKAGSENGLSAEAQLVVDDEWMEQYNEDNAEHYVIIPSEYYSFETQDIQMQGNEQYKLLNLTFKTSNLDALIDNNPDKKYALPIRLLSDNTTVSATNSYVILQPSIVVPTISFAKTGYQKTAITAQSNNPVQIEIPITLPLDNKWEFECTVKIDKEWLDTYNTRNGTSYQILPEAAYTLQKTCRFDVGNNSSSIKLEVDREHLSLGDYALPIKLESCTQNGFDLDENYHLAGISYLPPQIPLSLDMLSSNATVEGDGTGLTGLFDGLGSGKHYHSDYSGAVIDATYGHYIDIHLKTPIKSIMFDYYTRYENGNGDPTEITMYTSNDGQTWSKLAIITKSGLGGNAEYTSSIFTAENTFSYWRFSVTKSVAGDITNGAYFNIGELSIYGE